MIYTEAFFVNIKAELIRQIRTTRHSIYVAVAWFTDKDLLLELKNLAGTNKNVELLIFRDEINFGEWGIDFDMLKHAGGKLYLIDDKLMHNKFCVIDEKICITGSYNWTIKAGNKNEENIVIVSGDTDLAKSYIDQFKKLTGQPDETTNTDNIVKIIKRLKIITQFIELGDEQDIELHKRRIEREDTALHTREIILALDTKRYHEAVKLIGNFIKRYSSVTVYIDPEIAALQLELRQLEYQLIAIDNEIADYEKRIATFNHDMHLCLGTLMSEVYEAKLEYLRLAKEKISGKGKSEYDKEYRQTDEQYKEFRQQQDAEESRVLKSITDEEKRELKKMYREAVMICHPDRFTLAEKNIQDKASEFFKTLSEANERNDIAGVKGLLEKLKRGILDVLFGRQNNKELLLLELKEKKNKYKYKLTVLQQYKESEVIQILNTHSDTQVYFTRLRIELQKELELWSSRIKEMRKNS